MAGWNHRPGMEYDSSGLCSTEGEFLLPSDVELMAEIKRRIAAGEEPYNDEYEDEYGPHPCGRVTCGHLAGYGAKFCPVHAKKGTYL